MKISNSKKELARIISENGGWRYGARWATQDSDGGVYDYSGNKPIRHNDIWVIRASGEMLGWKIAHATPIKNWHQTILSREEYFHLYPTPDADGWIERIKSEPQVDGFSVVDVRFRDGGTAFGPAHVFDWSVDGGDDDIIAYRLHKPEQAKPEFCESVMRTIPEPEAKPTIEQLAADYLNAKDFAERKQQEADAAKADADARLKALELAGEAIGLVVSPIAAKQEPELVITDWHDLQAGDVISVSGKWWGPDSEYTVDENDGSRSAPIRVGGYWALIGECSFKFIRRP